MNELQKVKSELARVQEERRQEKIMTARAMDQMRKDINALTEAVKKLSDTRYKTSAREIINHEVQFKQKVYRSDGTLVTQINS